MVDHSQTQLYLLQDSPYSRPISEQIHLHALGLSCIRSTVDAMMCCQQLWNRLNKVFSASSLFTGLTVTTDFILTGEAQPTLIQEHDEISYSHSMQQHSKLFSDASDLWISALYDAQDSFGVWNYCVDQNMSSIATNLLCAFENVQKGLGEFLSTLRQSFPRFYLLSDDELLDLLATRDPLHDNYALSIIQKLFDNLATIEISESAEGQTTTNTIISSITSREGECLKLGRNFKV